VLAKRRAKTGDGKRANVPGKEAELPWNVTEQDPFYQTRDPEKVKEEAKEDGKSYWKPEPLS